VYEYRQKESFIIELITVINAEQLTCSAVLFQNYTQIYNKNSTSH